MALADCLRVYDQAMHDFIGGFSVSGNQVVTIMSTPDRPFAEVIQELVNSDEEFRSQMMETNLIASVARMDPVYNPKLRVDVPFGQLTHAINSDGDVIWSQHPRPYILPYQIDLRARTRTDANLWMQWIQFKFNPYVCLYLDFSPLWKASTQIQLMLGMITDNSELESDEKERWIRWTVNIRILNAFIFPMTSDSNDIPDMFGMLNIYPVVKKVVVKDYISPYNPPVPDPTIPGVILVDTVTRSEIDSGAVLPIESN